MKIKCSIFKQCGSCQMVDLTYQEQIKKKQNDVEKLLKKHCRVHPIKGMENPYHYRSKVQAAFGHQKGKTITGVYKPGTKILVSVEECEIEDQKANQIIGTIRDMLKSFKIHTYDEKTGYGLLRHVLVRSGLTTGEIMVVLVTGSPVFPSKNNFVKALRQKHPEITTIIQNVNDRNTSMMLGNNNKTLYGKGYIEDVLGGYAFRISAKSLYPVNPIQTEVLYRRAVEAAGLGGKETVLDAYCGVGTIGIIASKVAKRVIGVDMSKDLIRDAMENAKRNQIKNIQFYQNDAAKFIRQMVESGDHVDVVLMNPPRSGCTTEFVDAVAMMKPQKVVYVSSDAVTLERDLLDFAKQGYQAKEAWPVDTAPWMGHAETAVLLNLINI